MKRKRKVLLVALVVALAGLLLLFSFGVEGQKADASVAELSSSLVGTREAGEFKRLEISGAQVYASVQVISQLSDGSWEQPNHVGAWELKSHPGAFYLHRDGLGFRLDRLKPGSKAFLYRDWLMETKPLQLRVFKLEVIEAGDEALVWGRAGGNIFAFITCHPKGDSSAPQRLVVWAAARQGF